MANMAAERDGVIKVVPKEAMDQEIKTLAMGRKHEVTPRNNRKCELNWLHDLPLPKPFDARPHTCRCCERIRRELRNNTEECDSDDMKLTQWCTLKRQDDNQKVGKRKRTESKKKKRKKRNG